jgi:hypothetical protein
MLTVLVTLEAEGLAEPIRASSDPAGTVSRGDDFPHYPFTFEGGGASNDEPSRSVKLEIGNVDGRIGEAVRTVTGVPIATIETVRAATPDEVEIAIEEAEVSSAEIDQPSVTATLMPRDFDSEPVISKRYIRARTPGLNL